MTLKKLWGSFGRIYSCLQHDVLCRACFPSSHNALRFSAVHCHGAKNWQRYLFLWQIWLGASYAVKERKHLRIEAVQSMIKSASGKIRFELVALFLWLVFSIFMVYKGGELVKLLFIRGQVSPAMRVPMAYAYASVPVGCLLMSVRLIAEIMTMFKEYSLSEGGTK